MKGNMPGISSRYIFTAYSAVWPLEFEREASRLGAMVGDELVEVHHIGSTAVPGLAAKPIIDLLPEVRKVAHLDECKQKFVEAGYEAWGEYGIAGRRFFTKDLEDTGRTISIFSKPAIQKSSGTWRSRHTCEPTRP